MLQTKNKKPNTRNYTEQIYKLFFYSLYEHKHAYEHRIYQVANTWEDK